VRSRKAAWQLAVLLGAWGLAAHSAAEDARAVERPASAAVSPAAIDSAIAELKRDPNLGGQTKIRTLKWINASQPAPQSGPQWIVNFFDYMGQLSGLLLWALGAIAVAIAAVWGYRLLRTWQPRTESADAEPVAARILDLDISPDSLPADVGAVRASLDEPRANYFADLVRMWQRVVYAGDVVAPDDVAPLCARFGETLDERAGS
jgi:hypothetical protein